MFRKKTTNLSIQPLDQTNLNSRISKITPGKLSTQFHHFFQIFKISTAVHLHRIPNNQSKLSIQPLNHDLQESPKLRPGNAISPKIFNFSNLSIQPLNQSNKLPFKNLQNYAKQTLNTISPNFFKISKSPLRG